MAIYDIEELIAYARERSPFYRSLYGDLGDNVSLDALPILDQNAFWQAYRKGRLLTSDLRDGIVFKSGGTTGSPKFSVFSLDEWETFTQVFGRGMSVRGVSAGDKIANIFYPGELYASFVFIMKSIEHAGVGVHYPLGGAMKIASMIEAIEEFEVNVIAGVPSSLMSVAASLGSKTLPSVTKILFGGESLYPDQAGALQQCFPNARIQSIGYASVDAGLLGYYGDGCGDGEHRVFGKETIIEIVCEDSGDVIREPGRRGRVLLTNLTRRLMPIIRYPVGDCAEWIDDPAGEDPRFRLRGRSEEGARVGPVTLYTEDLRQMLDEVSAVIPRVGFQVVIEHFEDRDRLCLRLAVQDVSRDWEAEKEDVRVHLLKSRSMLADLVEKGLVHPPVVEVVAFDDLEKNPRTGKLRSVVDSRGS